MKHLLIAGFLTLSAASSFAQTTPPATQPATPPPAVDEKPTTTVPPRARVRPPKAGPDSVVAVRNLFRKRRNGGAVFTAAGSLIVLRTALADIEAGETAGSLVVAAPLIGIGVSKLMRFGSKKEEAYIKDYQAGKPLPEKVRRRLRPDYFRPKP